MYRRAKTIGIIVLAAVCLISVSAVDVFSAEYKPLEGVKSVKAVFDVRVGTPKNALGLLKLIHSTFQDKNIRSVTDKPKFAVVILGPAVRLVSKDRKGFSPEDQKTLASIADTIKTMSKDGIELEICMIAAHVFHVQASSILPEIKQVGNGWISLIGYQAQGYSLIPVY